MKFINLFTFLIVFAMFALAKNEDIIVADFEGGSYGDWKVEGEAFGTAPAKGTLANQSAVTGFKGQGLVNTYLNRDSSTGTLTSPELKIERDYLIFLIGGGEHKDVCMEVLVDGKVVASHSGYNNEKLRPSFFNLKKYKGKTMKIRVKDLDTGGWSHINLDHIVQTDTEPSATVFPQDCKLEFEVSKDYLILPIDESGPKTAMSFYVADKKIGDFEIALAESAEATDWHAFFSLERFKGQKAKLNIRTTLPGLKLVKQSDSIPSKVPFYQEKLRPQLHFTAKRGWLNDPNGMIFYDGLYHLYYQHNPLSTRWGNMTWGHATSPDMIHWTEQPKVLFPLKETGTCFSGASFIDSKNQLGKKTGKKDVIIAAYLRTEIGLCFAYSNDGGQTFTDYEKNPVITHAGARIDTPRPFWHEPTKRWVSPTYDFFNNEKGEKRRCVGFYSSANLKDWKFESRVEQDGWGDELCGCVDFFQLPIAGDKKNKKWVMIFIDGSYIIGDFDGKTFYTLEGKPAHTDDRIKTLVDRDKYGDYYATMTFENDPQGRRVQITWMGDDIPNMPFNQQMTIPSELTLHSTTNGPRLRMNPIEEFASLRKKTHKWQGTLHAEKNPFEKVQGELFDVEAQFAPGKDSKTIFDIRGVQVIYDAKSQDLICKGYGKDVITKIVPINGEIKLRIILDRTALEVYANDGRVYIPLAIYPDANNKSISLSCQGGNVSFGKVEVSTLNSIWKNIRN